MIRLVRPGHWIKNVIVLFPVVFAMRTDEVAAWRDAGLATVAFCLAASAIYIFNDIRDRTADRLHPHKKDRPLAAGRISVAAAVVEALCLMAGGIVVALCVNTLLPAFVIIYVLLQSAYTLLLKHKVIVDVICIALGFVLRAVAGAIAIGAEVSPWLFVCTFTLCLFMGFCKRCNEMATLAEPLKASGHRKALACVPVVRLERSNHEAFRNELSDVHPADCGVRNHAIRDAVDEGRLRRPHRSVPSRSTVSTNRRGLVRRGNGNYSMGR